MQTLFWLKTNEETLLFHLDLLGFPLGHSFSPVMHNAAMAASGIDGDYQLYPIPPSADGNSELEELIQSIRNGNLCGLNITIPYKQSVHNLVDRLTPLAAHIGAVNVLYMENGELIGDNTDCPAFLSDLKNSFHFEESSDHHALVLGAGGSARAVVYALHQEGWNVQIAARNEKQAKDLIASLGISNVQALNLEKGELSLSERNSSDCEYNPGRNVSRFQIFLRGRTGCYFLKMPPYMT